MLQRYLITDNFSINRLNFTEMKKSDYHVLGVMSGTSLDGIDLAEVFLYLSHENRWSFEWGSMVTVPYSEEWRRRLREAVHFSEGRMKTLNREYTQYLGGIISDFITKNKLTNLDAVCSHGHTVLHQPEKGLTLQIGNLPDLAQLIQENVVCDFRVQDVALGGQGAPLVPIGDDLLFGSYDYCLNLGGFANCSFEEDGKRIAFDICPVNVVLNFYAEQLGHPYDQGGKLAASGILDQNLLDKLNGLDFYLKPPPKSLGIEWVSKEIMPLMNTSKTTNLDKLHTYTEHIALQLAAQFENGSSLLITGGGAYNTYLIERLGSHKSLKVQIPDKKLIEYKEALVFGLLGVLKLREEVNCLASVTGAEKDHSSGVIF